MTDIAPIATPSPAAAEAAPIAAVAATAAAPAEAVTTPTAAEALATLDITKFTDSQVADLESGEPERINRALGITEKPAAAVVEKPNPSSEHADNGETKARISIKALKPEDRAKMVSAMELVRTGVKSPAEALAEAFGITALPPASTAVAPAVVETPKPAEATSQVHPKVAAIESELVTLRVQYQKAKESYDPAATDLLEQITDMKMDLRDARREAAIEAVQQSAKAADEQTWAAAQADSHSRAMAKFSELITDAGAHGDDGFVARCDYEIYLAEQRNDPILQQADWPEKIGQKVFDKFFKGKAANSAEPEEDESPLIPPAPNQKVRLPGSPVGAGFAAGGLSREAAEAEFGKLTWEERLDVLSKAEAASAKLK